MKTKTVQPLWKTFLPPARVAWEKNNLTEGQTLEKIARSNVVRFCLVMLSFAIIFGESILIPMIHDTTLSPSFSVFIIVISFTIFVEFIVVVVKQDEQSRKFLRRFENEAKELDLDMYVGFVSYRIPEAVENMLVLSAMAILVEKLPFEKNLKMSPEEGHRRGETYIKLKNRYDRQFALAVSFGLCENSKEEKEGHFQKAQAKLDATTIIVKK